MRHQQRRAELTTGALHPFTQQHTSHSRMQVGLFGSHAYSILDVREAATRTGETVRLLRIRNPHGVGEWNGLDATRTLHFSSIGRI